MNHRKRQVANNLKRLADEVKQLQQQLASIEKEAEADAQKIASTQQETHEQEDRES